MRTEKYTEHCGFILVRERDSERMKSGVEVKKTTQNRRTLYDTPHFYNMQKRNGKQTFSLSFLHIEFS